MTSLKGLIISAPSSAAGKTTVTLGLLRAFKNQGVVVRSAKSGPDYIDPRFHAAASGGECFNLDAWSMGSDRLCSLAAGDAPLIIEGAMGLFDGAPPDGKGSTADLAIQLGLPVVLVLDVSSQAQSVAAVLKGFSTYASDVNIAGVILNKVGSARHEDMLRRALEPMNIPILGAIHRQANLNTPSRHLGLVQAQEIGDLEQFLNRAGEIIGKAVDLDAVQGLMGPIKAEIAKPARLTPPAQRIAIAQDAAFAFAYPHILQDWHDEGAELSFFSPLADQAPAVCDMVFLPGGYPELHAGKLAAAQVFKAGMANAPRVYGECGGYMCMGKGLVDAEGVSHEMLGLLDLETSFAQRKLHLGYRNLTPNAIWNVDLKGHEFHYASTVSAKGDPLFRATDSEGNALPNMGLINGNYAGSFAHIIDRKTP